MLKTMSSELQRIARVAAANKKFQFRNLASRLTKEWLHEAYRQVRKNGAVGVDEVTSEQYAESLESNLSALYQKLKEQKYKAPKVRRSWIPKDGGKRPLGIPTFEDKIVQKSVEMLLTAIYEEDFYDFSYGYRKGKKLHDAVEVIKQQSQFGNVNYIIDADISGYFENISHKHLREFLEQRILDGSIGRLIGKWLNAGVLEDGSVYYPESGTPQGGVISPVLANIYLHYVLDEWFAKEVVPRMRGRVYVVRVADDFIIGCEHQLDAERIMRVLPKRMAKYNLCIHPGKTKLVDFSRPAKGKTKGNTFNFIGFCFYWGKSRKGKWVVKVKTAKKRLARTNKRIGEYCKKSRHKSVAAQHQALSAKLRGHYNYYGVTFNYQCLQRVYTHTQRSWFKWLNRRGGKRCNWGEFKGRILNNYVLPRPKVVHSFRFATNRQLSLV